MKKHWFFDLDGTLARTGEDIISALKGALASCGYDVSRVDEMFVIGPPLDRIFLEMYPDRTPSDFAAVLEAFKPLYDESDYPTTVPYQGVPEMLAELSRRGAKVYIATNKRQAPTRRIAAKFGWDVSLDGVWSYDSLDAKCTKSELLAKLADRYGISAEDAVMVGDMSSDVTAGKANGFSTVGVTWGYGSADDLSAADFLCSSANEILALDIAKSPAK